MASQIIRFWIAVIAGALVSQLWLALAMAPVIYAYGDISSLRELAEGVSVEFPIILLSYVLLGAPACLLARLLKLRGLIWGPVYGFVVGLIGSQAYVSNLFSLYDLSFAIVSFGIAGALGAAAFVVMIRKQDPAVSSASTPV